MKTNKYTIIAMSLLFSSTFLISCNNDDDNSSTTPVLDFSGTYTLQDQMARPAINTVFIASGTPKDDFNKAIPSQMASYQGVFKTRLMQLNSAYTTNALGQTATQLSTLLATDVLGVDKTKKTTFFDSPTLLLTGRALADDVIDTELLLIFGGPSGTSNPGLIKDNVNKNDKDFLVAFPYLATAW